MVVRRLTVMGFSVCLLGAANPAYHPIHTTFTEIVQTAPSIRVTVTIRGFEDDLGAAARVASPGGTIDSAIARYLRQQTALTDRSNRGVPLTLAGTRRAAGVVWFTFRSLGPADLEGGRFLNTTLTERFTDQVNLVQVKIGGRTRSLLFTPGDKAKPINPR